MADENDEVRSDHHTFNDYAIHPITSDGRTSPRVDEPEPEDVIWLSLPPELVHMKETIRSRLNSWIEGYREARNGGDQEKTGSQVQGEDPGE